MKIKKRIAAIILLGCCAGLTTPAIAQKKNKLKKGPNISLNISAKKDSIKTTYLNLGLLTNIYRLQGVGINAISSVAQSDMTSSLRPGKHHRSSCIGYTARRYCQCSRCKCQWSHAQRFDERGRKPCKRHTDFRIGEYSQKYFTRCNHRWINESCR